jgi:hypothetical protein
LSDIGAYASDPNMLFIGEEKSSLYKEIEKVGYDPLAISLEEAESGIQVGEEYGIVIIDRIPRSQDMRLILTRAVEYLMDGGILWFDGPDLDKSIKNLEKKGAAMWKGETAEVCLTDSGLEAIGEKYGLFIRSYRHVGTSSGRIEVVAQKKY